MTVPYLPGWWDEISKGTTNLVAQLPNILQPDRVAQKRLEEAIQQNPGMLEMISNMDPQQRQAIASGFGFRKQNPFGALPEGQKLKETKLKNEAIGRVASTPEGQAELDAAITQTKNPQERKAQQLTIQKIEQDIQRGVTEGKLSTLKLAELERESNRLKTVLEKSAPDVAAVARSVVAGRNIDPATAERIGADPFLKATYDDYVRSMQLRLQTDAQKYIASLKTPVEKQLGLDALKTQILQTQQQLTEATNFTSGREGMMNQLSMDPNLQQAYKQSLQMIPVLRSRVEQLNKVYIDNLKKMGMSIPDDMQFLSGIPSPQATTANPFGARPPLGSLVNQFNRPPL